MINHSDKIKSYLEATVWHRMSEHSIASKLMWKIADMIGPSETILTILARAMKQVLVDHE